MKPEYRSSATLRVAPDPAPVTAVARPGLVARLLNWLDERQRHRQERLQLEALALLGRHLLQDIGMNEAVRERALARCEALYERAARSPSEGGAASERWRGS